MRVSEGVCPELNSWILGYMLKYLHIMRSNNRPALLIFARQYITVTSFRLRIYISQ